MENASGNNFKFVQALVTTLRQIAFYPPRHPSIINSLKTVLSTLNLVFIDKEKFNLNISPDKLLLIEGQPLEAKDMATAGELVALIEKLGVEDLIFTKGITEEELDGFIQLIAGGPKGESPQKTELNKLFAEKGISHIVARQFSYLKVEKGKEPILSGKERQAEGLKVKVKAYCAGGLADREREGLEKELFDLAASELKEKGKLAAALRTMLRRYFQHDGRQLELGDRLRQALAECGIPAAVAEAAVKKITEDVVAGAVKSGRPADAAVSPEIMRENVELKARVAQLSSQLDEQNAAVERLTRENKKAFDEKHRIDNIIHNLAEGMVVVDAEGKIILANTTAENMLGITDSYLGKQVKDVVHDQHLLTMTKDCAAEKDGVVEKDIEFLSPDDTTRKILRASSAVVEDKDGNTIGMVTMLNDITRQRELEKMKTDFLSNVSHELRTPLVAIQKSVALMLQKEAGEISETQSQFLSIAERNLKRLTFLINDLLDLAKFEAGKMELKCESVVVDTLIAESLESLDNWARTKSLKMERKVFEGLSPVWGDPNRLTQVLVNLVGNAIKFTPQGGGITVTAEPGDRDAEVRVIVADTGVGIPREELGRIFDKFYQTKQRASSDISGTGIGLAIVREIVQLHGGKVWAESDGSSGARFMFTLSTGPVAAPDGAA